MGPEEPRVHLLLWLCCAVLCCAVLCCAVLCCAAPSGCDILTAGLQAIRLGAGRLALFTGLTGLTYRDIRHVVVDDAVPAIAQLTRLRSPQLQQKPTFSDVQLAQLSTLSRLTNLAIWGGDLLPLNPTLQNSYDVISEMVVIG